MIKIYVGENGAGKSRKLGDIAKERIQNGDNVIAIATTLNDKFPRRDAHKPYHYMGSRLGRFVAREAIKESFIKSHGKQDLLLSTVFTILEYVKYDLKIGISIQDFSPDASELLYNYRTSEREANQFLATDEDNQLDRGLQYLDVV